MPRARPGLPGRGDSEEAWAGRWRRAQRACATQRYDREGGNPGGPALPSPAAGCAVARAESAVSPAAGGTGRVHLPPGPHASWALRARASARCGQQSVRAVVRPSSESWRGVNLVLVAQGLERQGVAEPAAASVREGLWHRRAQRRLEGVSCAGCGDVVCLSQFHGCAVVQTHGARLFFQSNERLLHTQSTCWIGFGGDLPCAHAFP